MFNLWSWHLYTQMEAYRREATDGVSEHGTEDSI
jgi:hypothetical protein